MDFLKKIDNLLEITKANGYSGYDPLNNEELLFARLNFRFSNRFSRLLRKFEKLLILLLPNLGSFYNLLGIKQRINVYGLGVFIQAYMELYAHGSYDNELSEAKRVYEIAETELKNITKNRAIPYPVPASTEISLAGIILKKDTGILIATIEYALGVLELYKQLKDSKIKLRLDDLADCIANDFKSNNQDSISLLNYTTDLDKTNVINVNALALDFLSQYSSLLYVNTYDLLITEVYLYILPELQKSIIPYQLQGNDKHMDVYHTGFTLRGMYNTSVYLGRERDTKNIEYIIENKYFNWFIDDKTGLVFNLYPNTFFNRFIDIQGLSEFILMYSKFSYLNINHNLITESIEKSLNVMVDSKFGYKYRWFNGFSNRIYMPRWSNAVMLRAFAGFLNYGSN